MAVKNTATSSQEFSDSVINTVREPLIILDGDLRVITASHSFCEFFKVKPEETVGQLIYDLGNKQWDIPELRELLENILPKKTTFDNYEVEHDFATIGKRIVLLNARQIQRASDKEKIILLAMEDITSRRLAEKILTDSEDLYRNVFKNASDGILLLEKSEGRITHMNTAAEKMLGYSAKESIGGNLRDIGFVFYDDFQKMMRELNTNGIINYTDVPVKTKSGQHIDTDIYIVNKTRTVQCNIRDIAQRKQAEKSLQKSEENFRLSLDDSPLGIRIVTAQGETLYANRAIADIYGYNSIEEFKGAPLKDLYTPQSYAEFRTRKEKRDRGEFSPFEYEISIVRKNGEVRQVHVIRKEILWNGARQYQIVYQDITERKQAEEILKQSESKYRLLADNIHDIIFVMDMNLNYTYVSPSVKIMRGYEPKEVLQQSSLEAVTPSSRDLAMKTFFEVMELEKSKDRDINISRTLQLEMIRKDGTTVWTEMKFSFIRDEDKRAVGIVGVTRDITERKLSEEELRKSEEKYRMVVENAKEAIIVTQDMQVVFVNRAGLDMIGYSENVLNPQPITDFIHPDDIDMVVDHHLRRLKGEDVQPFYSFRILNHDGTVKWVEINAAVIQWKEKPATLNFLNDVTERKQAEAKLLLIVESLKKAFGTIIQVMVSTVEMRDPYTAGHQLRVADMACAIAAEMGLPREIIDGISMAGSIHDIGKLSIPAEILSKPTKLTNNEFNLIKEHAQSGYEMLKNVESPWPLAQIVYQHHERTDGSGYPQGLKGDEILMEARIMAVADVVEAMASHRPYRAALGIEVALGEIERNSGILYDTAVADACLKLFRKKGYKLIVQ